MFRGWQALLPTLQAQQHGLHQRQGPLPSAHIVRPHDSHGQLPHRPLHIFDLGVQREEKVLRQHVGLWGAGERWMEGLVGSISQGWLGMGSTNGSAQVSGEARA